MNFFRHILKIIIFSLSFQKIKSFVVLTFDTIFVKDKTIEEKDYFSNLTQTELYINITLGSKKESIKCVLKMEKNGFIIYEKAYDFNNSTSYEKFDKDINIRWIPSSMRFPSRDKFYLPNYDSYKSFKKNKISEKSNNITNKTEFLLVEEINIKNPNYLNEMFYEYGIVGLQLIANSYYTGLEFVKSLKKANETNSYTFHLFFENKTKKGFAMNDNKGYILIGEELTDNEKNKDNIEYIKCLEVKTYSQLIWGMKLDNIYLKYNNSYIKEIEDPDNNSEFIVNYPFIKGSDDYFRFINKHFFDEFFDKNICIKINFIKHDIYTKENSYGYACDSTSKYFMDKLNNNFPELILYNNDFNKNFSLTKNDLFAFNAKNESDTYLYFLIVHGIDDENRWILGIPFLKKYIFSFDYDKKRIGYYINYGKEIEEDINDKGKEKNNFFKSDVFKVIIIILSAGIIFVMGMIFNNYLKKSRKKRANELDDVFEYNTYEDINNNNDEGQQNKIINES